MHLKYTLQEEITRLNHGLDVKSEEVYEMGIIHPIL